jgi:hypothetical protein
MALTINVGSVLHWRGFRFNGGDIGNKYFVVLAARPDRNWLFVIATSKKKRREYSMGCHEKEGYYHLPNGGKDFFKKDTWLLLMECKEVDRAAAIKLLSNGDLTKEGSLREAVINAIRDCMRRCEDVSAAHLAVL